MVNLVKENRHDQASQPAESDSSDECAVDPKRLEEFKRLFHIQTGRDLSDAEALDRFIKLVNLVKVVYRPILPGLEDEFAKLEDST